MHSNPLYFEDFEVGQRFVTNGATLTEAQIIDFAWQHDPQPFHIDAEAAKDSPYGGIIASGFQTHLVTFRLVYQENIWNTASMGSPGIDELRGLKPVRPGDTLHVEFEVKETNASTSRSDRGYVRMAYATINQAGETVMSYLATHILRTRPADAGAA